MMGAIGDNKIIQYISVFAELLFTFSASAPSFSAALSHPLSLHGAWITQLQSCFFSLTDFVYVSLDRDPPPTDVLELSRVLITSNVLHGVKEPGVISTFPKRLYKAGVFFSSRG